ncbi:PREDICTED: ubiquitin-like domain-containing CTD phosphatase 1 [Acropora digitifera]|uniref:ubiquitin-like domain-containing CTD phosphatase 1 n=1 Tax=Acropora digitifera TaxID=70779 RepID=UPI00077B047C|nr:PREDICTED: ubiquitin-like domain-containing CTD phosphatase 1 [Acropora digitifera]
MAAAKEAGDVNVIVKWSGKEYVLEDVPLHETVRYLKNLIKEKTGVLPERQKLLGLKCKGKNAQDDVRLSALNLKPSNKIMMMGTREENLAEVIAPSDEVVNNQVVNDFDIEEDEIQIENKYAAILMQQQERPEKVRLEGILNCGVEWMDEWRKIFLKAATSMKWIEAKMKELGILDNPNFKICFLLDSGAMITVLSPKYGLIETKPLGVIWGKFEEYNSKNTIMFDDLRRNFLMNPQNGLKIRPFREAHKNRQKDTELLKLAKYLKRIARLDDLSGLNHKYWERFVALC